MFTTIDNQAVNAVRALSIAQIEAANSGHPGLPLGASPMAYVLWSEHLRVNPYEPNWVNRDRFVLSAGHGSAMLYSLLHLSGFDVSIDDLKQFRQYQSKTPGHPEVGHTPGVDATTGPLGQGIAQAVGMAMAERHTAALFNTSDHQVIDHFTYALCGDGDLMEGVAYEAISYAGTQELDKLIVLYDSNDISLDGNLHQSFREDIRQRFESANWHYLKVEDGNDLEAISQAISLAKSHEGQPTLIEVKTEIGFGSPLSGSHKVHGAPLGEQGWEATKAAYQWMFDHFDIPEEIYAHFANKVTQRGQDTYESWLSLMKDYQKEAPDTSQWMCMAFDKQLPEDFHQDLPVSQFGDKGKASRASSGEAINHLAQRIPFFWGGSADLASSNKTMIENGGDFMPENPQGRNIWFGVREFAMAAMMNGIMLHGGSRVFGGTFFVFSDYLKAAIRLSAISKLPVIYVLTHDSIAVGEDGPTHEPVEQLAAFRAMPDVNVIRPADSNEVNAAWTLALKETEKPTLLILSRQDLPVLPNSDRLAFDGVQKGAYVLSHAKEDAQGLLIATGSEVSLAVEAQQLLQAKDIHVSVVSMPSMNLFDQQSDDYKESVLPKAIRNRLSIEMGSSFGWGKYIGLDGETISVDTFGLSANATQVLEHFGFNAESIAQTYTDKFLK